MSIRKLNWTLMTIAWIFISTFFGIVAFTGWPVLGHPLAKDLEHAVYGTLGLSVVLFLPFAGFAWQIDRQTARYQVTQPYDKHPSPETWPEKLREAARWFDMFDELANYIEVYSAPGARQKYLLSSMLSGTEIQDDLRALADLLETDKTEI